jgi:hypothetical protein
MGECLREVADLPAPGDVVLLGVQAEVVAQGEEPLEQWAQRIAGGVTAPPSPPLPRRWALARARKARLTCSGAASRLNCLMGFNSVLWGSTRRQGHLVWFAGAAAVDSGCGAGNFRAAAGRLSPCRPDHEAPRCGCRRPVLACSSIPGDRDHRFRRSGPRTGHAARAAPPLFACGMPTRAALIVLAWAGDGSPIRGCTT